MDNLAIDFRPDAYDDCMAEAYSHASDVDFWNDTCDYESETGALEEEHWYKDETYMYYSKY